jgi:hypothetical protein
LPQCEDLHYTQRGMYEYRIGACLFGLVMLGGPKSLEESLSISTGLATWPSRLAPKKCINKSIWLATGGAPSMGTTRVPSGCQPN